VLGANTIAVQMAAPVRKILDPPTYSSKSRIPPKNEFSPLVCERKTHFLQRVFDRKLNLSPEKPFCAARRLPENAFSATRLQSEIKVDA